MACFYFKYTPATGSPLYLDDEPIKWDAVKITLKRDRDWHGVNYEYTDVDIPLEFDCLSGAAFIEQIYQSEGSDGYIGFEFGYYNGVVEIPEYQGKINLSTRRLLSTYRISAMVERDGLHDKIKSRWSTKANLFAAESIDGNAITPVTPLDLQLHSKVLINNYTKTTTVDGTGSFQPFLEDLKMDVWFVFDTTPTSAVNSNINTTIGSGLGPTGDNPITSNLALLFDLNANGSFVFNISLSYVFNIKLTRRALAGKPKIGNWFLDHWLEVRDINGVQKIHQRIGTRLSGYRDGQFLNEAGSVNASASISNYTADLVYGDRVYIYAHFHLDGVFPGASWKGVEAYIVTSNTSFDITAETTTPVSTTKMILIHEALTQAVAVITGENDAVYSDFFGREDLGYPLTGCGALKAITNGFQIRKFGVNDNPVKLSPQELMNSGNSIFCLGMGYEEIGGSNKLRIEERGYFYQDVEIMFLPEIGDYKEEVANDKIHNTVNVGYSKYLDEGLRLLDEYNTEHQYTSPVTNSSNPLDIRSSLIASGYAIEITRRFQYEDAPKDSTKYDDDGFFIAVIANDPESVTGQFDNYGGAVFIYSGSISMQLNAGDTVRISGSASNDGDYLLTGFQGNYLFFNLNTFTPETATITIDNLTKKYKSEKDEAFDIVDGVISFETSYNLRHTPKRNLLNWAKWLNGGMFFKQPGDIIRNTFVKQNGNLITKLTPGEPCPLGDVNLAILKEKDDEYLGVFQNKDYFFIPEWISFKTRITMDNIRIIRNCMTGQDDQGRNYGYISCLNQDGNFVYSWIYDMTYNPNTEEVTFLCLKKEVVLVNPPSPLICSDYADFTFSDFETLPNLSVDIEQCLFVNFN